MTARELIALLQRIPAGTEVATWNGNEPEAIEQVVLSTLDGGPVLVLGMEMGPSFVVDGAEVQWTADETAARGLAKAQAEWAVAKREWVG